MSTSSTFHEPSLFMGYNQSNTYIYLNIFGKWLFSRDRKNVYISRTALNLFFKFPFNHIIQNVCYYQGDDLQIFAKLILLANAHTCIQNFSIIYELRVLFNILGTFLTSWFTVFASDSFISLSLKLPDNSVTHFGRYNDSTKRLVVTCFILKHKCYQLKYWWENN